MLSNDSLFVVANIAVANAGVETLPVNSIGNVNFCQVLPWSSVKYTLPWAVNTYVTLEGSPFVPSLALNMSSEKSIISPLSGFHVERLTNNGLLEVIKPLFVWYKAVFNTEDLAILKTSVVYCKSWLVNSG